MIKIDPEALKSISETIQRGLAHIQKGLEPLKDGILNFALSLERVPESVKVLAEKGWYLPFNFHPPTINHYASELRNGNHEFVDEEMVLLIDSEIARIENELIEKFPKRKAPIQAAIKAHKNRDYYLSVPVFFSQAEGICQELTKNRFFSVRNGQPLTNQWLNNFESDSIMLLVLEPLKHNGVARKIQEKGNPLGTNRHDVLHGTSVDYGEDKTNSYKALSLLNYIGETIYMARQQINETEK
ncbi:MAG: hypothetical protein RIG68_24060 [Imperialibacter sp.]|uniref:hypothetical protein n=1 Tax=Imperialibacter sp. TaxID=2038411 RepID=UPI0032EB0C65